MKRENFVTLQGWMYDLPINDIREMVLFAIIYGFSQDGKSKFYGSLNYISSILMLSRPTTIKLLKSLIEKGLIKKIESNGMNLPNAYEVNFDLIKSKLGSKGLLQGGSKEFLQGSKGFLQSSKELLQGGSKELLHNIYNKDKNNNIYNSGTSFVFSPSDEGSKQTTSYASQEKSKSDLPLNSKKVKKYNMADAENFNADGEKIAEPTQEGAPPTSKEGKARTKLFRNSIYSDYARLVERFKKMPEQRRIKYRGLDIDWYIEAVENWSEKKQVKRTDEGWFRTILDFMRRDMAEGKAQWLKGHNPNERKNDSLYD